MSEVTNRDPLEVAQRPLATMAALEPIAIEWLLICVAQDRTLFDEMQRLIQPHHFDPREMVLRLLYEGITACHLNYHGVSYEALASTVDSLSRNEAVFPLNPQQRQLIFERSPNGLIQQVCDPTVSITPPGKSYARSVLMRLANERTVLAPLRTAINPGRYGQNDVPEASNIRNLLDTVLVQQAKISATGVNPVVDIAPEVGTPLVAASVVHKTGVDFIDTMLGGYRERDCNGLIGPTGGGKTTFGVHLIAQNAKQNYADWVTQGRRGEPKVAVYITAEENAIKLRPRIWANFFQIERSRLDRLTSWDQLSRPGQLHAYEAEMQRGQEQPLSELERYQIRAPQLRQCFRALDYSGSDEFPNAGSGYVPELASGLLRLEREISLVYIDYAGLFCTRYLQSNGNFDERRYRSLLKQFGDDVRRQICERFNCTAWVAHQLKGAAGTASPTKLMHHSDAGESSDFADNMAVCFCLGTEDKATGCRILNPSKVRYLPGEEAPPVILKINKFAMMQDVTRNYVINQSKIMSLEDADRVGGLENNQPQTGPQGSLSTMPVAGGDPLQSSEITP